MMRLYYWFNYRLQHRDNATFADFEEMEEDGSCGIPVVLVDDAGLVMRGSITFEIDTIKEWIRKIELPIPQPEHDAISSRIPIDEYAELRRWEPALRLQLQDLAEAMRWIEEKRGG